MPFELRPEIVDQIIFGMENQERDFFVDLHTGVVANADEIDEYQSNDEERSWVPIPDWRSVHGYNLMERFITELRNPLFRERLRQILVSGRGIFRQFKDALKERPEIEQMWFRYKEREMRRRVYEWYNELREQWGLEQLPVDLETETGDLILADFAFEDDILDEEEVQEFGDQAFVDALGALDPGEQELLEDILLPAEEGDLVSISASTPAGERVGLIACRLTDGAVSGIALVEALFIIPEYRGLGLARELLYRMLQRLKWAGLSTMHIDLPGSADILEKLLREWGAETVSRRMRLDIERWSES